MTKSVELFASSSGGDKDDRMVTPTPLPVDAKDDGDQKHQKAEAEAEDIDPPPQTLFGLALPLLKDSTRPQRTISDEEAETRTDLS